MIRNCLICNKEFNAVPAKIKVGKGKYCSKACYSASRPQQIECACTFCGKKIKRYWNYIKDQKNVFCSRACQGQWMSTFLIGDKAARWAGRGSIDKVCETCGKTFSVLQTVADLGKGRFCSQECYWKWLPVINTGDKCHFWRGAKLNITCEQCGTEFETFLSLTKDNRGRFCSQKCQGKWQSEYRIGENSSNWLGGKSFEPYPITFNDQFKKAIRQRDGYTCALCPEFGRNVHHIDYDKENTTPENCITLCDHCHPMTNHNREHWQRVLSDDMLVKYGGTPADLVKFLALGKRV